MNVDLLTKSHSAIAAKRRARNAQIKEILFDEDARRTFLTGFHKRKVARREEARKRAQLREKQERLEMRREHRRALAERAAQNTAEVEKACGVFAENEEDEPTSEREKVKEEEYEDEEQLATVTVVQDIDLSALRYGPPPASGPAREVVEGEQVRRRRKTKREKVKYETKAARRAEQRKQLARRNEKAARARR